MREQEHTRDGDCPYSWINEWLCEYVDGTMDPSLRRVFDKYVQANPELRDHVERLRHTRQLLCACSEEPKQKAPDSVCARVQEKVECDMLRTPRSLQEAVRERPIAAFASTLVVALVIGMFTGAALFAPEMMPAPMVQETQPGSAAQYERATQQRTITPSNAAMRLPSMPSTMGASTGLTSFHPLTEYDAGMTYASDSMASLPAWRAMLAQP
jgi:anti-sigma factor RsiW